MMTSVLPRRLRSHAALVLLVALLASLCSVIGAPAAPAATPGAAAAATTIAVNGAGTGRTFDGIGAISGGGGNSRLLIDYPPAQRQQILDYLFEPGYGADLQILKVEIGGDTNSTDGAEPSIEHTAGNVQCGTGYEFWLMQQAKALNPNIKLYGLAWGAPGWIGGGDFWSTDTINYLVSWLGCAKADGLTIDYLGGWNERGYNIAWYEQLRSTLNADGYSGVQIVGADSDWSVANDIDADPAFANAVQVIGSHYPCQGDGGPALSCSTTSQATSSGKPLWASENGSQDMDTGAPALIRSIVRGYTDARMTAYLNWPLIAAITPNLPYPTDGMMTAGQPWSGNYSVGESAWATAQVTQFTEPGWQFLDSGSGYLGGAEGNGAYVSLKSTNGSDYSTVIETTTATAAQTVNVNVSGGLSNGTVHVWSTDVNAPSPATALIHSQDITPANGSYSLTVQPGYIYTLTTTTGQGKGTAVSPAPATLGLPYNDSYDQDATGSEPQYLQTMQGAYQVEPCLGGRSGQCVQQLAPTTPIEWQSDSDAYGLIGDTTWSNYTVSSDVYLNQAGTAELFGRANKQDRPQSDQAAYLFRVSDSGAWSIDRSDAVGSITTLASGTVSALGTGRWHTIALNMWGTALTASIDGTTVGSASDGTYQTGQAGLGVVGYQTDQFDNLAVNPLPGGYGTYGTGPATSGLAGLCLDNANGSISNGNKVDIGTCDNSTGQRWTPSNGIMKTNSDMCLDVVGSGSTANGSLVDVWFCNGGPNQIWIPQANGELLNPQSGRCLDDPALSTTPGTQLDIWDCNDGANQRWALPPIVGPVTTGVDALCLDDANDVTTDGNKVDIYGCNDTNAQRWQQVGSALMNNGKCLDVTGSGATANGTPVELYTCNNGANQVWTPQADGELLNPQSGRCLDDPGFSTTPGTQLQIYDCNDGANQQWALPAA
ncbi:ricin-type beta-trefoil lectin domain protein [Catenulispora sp. NF23]|uniref:galactosylceramidase n=2 Tax=Catenulispora pinistramenti TaxID=2705254 RepID=A0ABS5KU34_9ACTN|nr:ricin-type beta-trefoil lectin domain protein [Catenulispora pinistramenti]MBS2549545.1 ricin-type beta-trefoil lectin domain protein [Catenulispora pinistramenti]